MRWRVLEISRGHNRRINFRTRLNLRVIQRLGARRRSLLRLEAISVRQVAVALHRLLPEWKTLVASQVNSLPRILVVPLVPVRPQPALPSSLVARQVQAAPSHPVCCHRKKIHLAQARPAAVLHR
ncbi:MAG: hypothetical protein ACKO0N_06480 [Planctomycetota bacterium]